MASLRSLKKDVDYLLSLVLGECFYVIDSHPEVDKKKVMEIAWKVISGHRELRLRINHIDGKDNPDVMKAYLRKVVDDLYSLANTPLEELSKLIARE